MTFYEKLIITFLTIIPPFLATNFYLEEKQERLLLESLYNQKETEIDTLLAECNGMRLELDSIKKELDYQDNTITGLVSFYDDWFEGRLTKNGEVFSNQKFTCAASSIYKIGDVLRVTNKLGKFVTVRVTDRGNFERLGRTLDLSKIAFKQLSDLKKGVIQVHITKIK